MKAWRVDIFHSKRNIGGQFVQLNILVVRGARIPLGDKLLRESDVLLFGYCICNRESFENIRENYSDWMRGARGRSEKIVVVFGTKSDLEEEREVGMEEGQRLSKEYNGLFFETSAKSGRGMEF